VPYHERFAREAGDEDALHELVTARFEAALEASKLKTRPEAIALFRRTADELEELRVRNPGRRAYRAMLARVHGNLANLLGDVGDDDGALRHFRLGLELRRELVRTRPDGFDERNRLAGLLNNYGAFLSNREDPVAAEAAFREAIEIRSGLAEAGGLSGEDAKSNRAGLAYSWTGLGSVRSVADDWTAARDALRRAVALWDGLVGEPLRAGAARPTEWLAGSAAARTDLARVLRVSGDPAAALSEARRALAVRQGLADQYPDVSAHRFELASSHDLVAALSADTGDRPAALRGFRSAAGILKRLTADEPAVIRYRERLGRVLYHIGDLLSVDGDLGEAAKNVEESLEIRRALAAAEPRSRALRADMGRTLDLLGEVRRRAGEHASARRTLEEAVRIFDGLTAEGPGERTRLDAAATLDHYASLIFESGDTAGAIRAVERAVSVLEPAVGDRADGAKPAGRPRSPDAASHLGNLHDHLAWLHLQVGDAAAVETHFRAALGIRRRLVDGYPLMAAFRRDLAATYRTLARLRRDAGKPAEAVALLREGLAALAIDPLSAAAPLESRTMSAVIRTDIGIALARGGDPDGAAREFREALAVRERLSSDQPSNAEHRRELAGGHRRLGNHLAAQGRLEEAEASLSAARLLAVSVASEDVPPVLRRQRRIEAVGIARELAGVLRRRKRGGDAVDMLGSLVGETLLIAGEARSDVSLCVDCADLFLAIADEFREMGDARSSAESLTLGFWLAAGPAAGSSQSARRAREAVAGLHDAAALMHLHAGRKQVATACDARRDSAGGLAGSGKAEPRLAFDAACSMASLLPVLSGKDADAVAERAVVVLRVAFDHGSADTAAVEAEPALEPVRSRPEFRKSMAEWKEKVGGREMPKK
jgi:tetratricopeptide (TPR) repeat protein